MSRKTLPEKAREGALMGRLREAHRQNARLAFRRDRLLVRLQEQGARIQELRENERLAAESPESREEAGSSREESIPIPFADDRRRVRLQAERDLAQEAADAFKARVLKLEETLSDTMRDLEHERSLHEQAAQGCARALELGASGEEALAKALGERDILKAKLENAPAAAAPPSFRILATSGLLSENAELKGELLRIAGELKRMTDPTGGDAKPLAQMLLHSVPVVFTKRHQCPSPICPVLGLSFKEWVMADREKGVSCVSGIPLPFEEKKPGEAIPGGHKGPVVLPPLDKAVRVELGPDAGIP